MALLAVAAGLLVFTKTLAVWTGRLGAFGFVGWSGFYVSALILVVFGIERLVQSPRVEARMQVIEAGNSELVSEPIGDRKPEKLAS